MNILIVYESVHHNNTQKVAERMAKILNCESLKTEEAKAEQINEADLLGLGSGIYFGKHHRNLLSFVDKLPEGKGKKVFIFSTSGVGKVSLHKTLKEKLESKDYEVIDEFSCKAYDTYGPLKLVGGMNKGRPNEKDLEEAANFARNVKSKI